jgi:hypothetical protein
MSEPTDFVIDLDGVDHSKWNDRILASLLKERAETLLYPGMHTDAEIKKPSYEVIELYLAAVRRRNGLRRNWHPEKSYQCDEAVLNLITRQAMKGAIGKSAQDYRTRMPDGEYVFTESEFEAFIEKVLDSAYGRNGKRKQLSPLEAIVRRILKSYPEATAREVVHQMRNNQNEYNIVEMDDTTVIIREPLSGTGKHTINKSFSISTIKNIVTRLKK